MIYLLQSSNFGTGCANPQSSLDYQSFLLHSQAFSENLCLLQPGKVKPGLLCGLA